MEAQCDEIVMPVDGLDGIEPHRPPGPPVLDQESPIGNDDREVPQVPPLRCGDNLGRPTGSAVTDHAGKPGAQEPEWPAEEDRATVVGDVEGEEAPGVGGRLGVDALAGEEPPRLLGPRRRAVGMAARLVDQLG